MRLGSPAQIKRAAVAFVIATGLAVTTMFSIVNDGESSDSNRMVAARSGVLTIVEHRSDDRFLEEQRYQPSGAIRSARTPYADITFLEQNLSLPASSSSTRTHPTGIKERNQGEGIVSKSPLSGNNDLPQQDVAESRSERRQALTS